MLNLAAKLKAGHKTKANQLSSAIFGGISQVSTGVTFERPTLRVGFWPIQSETEASVAMGLSTLIASLLECWPTVRVYRLLAQVGDGTEDYQWTIEKSQFDVDDWELDGLDENAAVWGTLTNSGSHYELTLEIENDLADDTSKIESWKAESLSKLVNLLPEIAERIAAYLGAGEIDSTSQIYKKTQSSDHNLKQILTASFEWELSLFLNLWGQLWTDDQIVADYEKLSALGQLLDKDLGDWIVSSAVARIFLPFYPYLDAKTPLLEYVEKISLEPTTGLIYRHAVALALYRAGYSLRAYDLLEQNVAQFPDNIASWTTLIELYWNNNEIGTALNTIQRALQTGLASAALHVRYAEILLTFDASNLLINVGTQRVTSTGRTFIEDYHYIDTEQVSANRLIHEAMRAYQAALLLEPNNLEILFQLIIQLIDLQEPNLWIQFEKLVELDQENAHVRNMIEIMSSLEDIQPAIKILRLHVEKNANDAHARINLAAAYLLNEQTDNARTELEIAIQLSRSKTLNSEIERLLLSVDDPDFDSRLGEITDLLNAGNDISADDVDFLELTVENAPTFAPGYVLLANAYLNWNEMSDALDTLLDGQRQLPDHPDISVLLARVLWEAGEKQLAFDCLNTALAKTPMHVPALAVMGQFLFEDGQENEAKAFLTKAEAIEPRSAVLNNARIHIANIIAGLDTN
jgi:cytochrome c-type biogenesis protein CcmH/NrfG